MQPTKDEKDALIALFREQRFSDALAAARAMARTYPKALDAWNIRGAAARALGQLLEAEKSFREVERLAPNFAGAPYNLGLVLENKGEGEGAAQAYARALRLDPDMAQAHNNLGSLCLRLGQAEPAYKHLKRATELQPAWPEVHNSFGNVLKRLGRMEEARAAYKSATEAKPDFAKAHYNLGVLESELHNRKEAIAAFRAALALEPENALARLMLLHELSQTCDWDAMHEHEAYLPKLGVETAAVPPFIMLSLEDDPARQLARSRNWAKARFGGLPKAPRPPAQAKTRPERLRIAYIGADFHDHPGMRLMTGMLAAHDRSRFEVHAISYGRLREDIWRERAKASVDVFHDVHTWNDSEVLNLLRALQIDVALDRQGYTAASRIDWFAHRIAPVQINYLGFASSVAAPFMDYMVADPTIIAPHHREHYGEKIIYLPHCYQPSNDTLEIAKPRGTRADHGLSEEAVVLCCFNNLYKLNAHVFAIWMRILRKVDAAVLWLFASNDIAQTHLRAAAQKAGVDPSRLIFAPRLPNPEHLERHRHADLFLDTWPCNAHTTCNDALLTGLPVVTRIGEQLASRVAASVLQATGLPDLVTRSDKEYEALILELATNREKRLAVRSQLAARIKEAPMFDTALYTRHLEAGFDAAYDRALKGLPPADIEVPDQTGQNG